MTENTAKFVHQGASFSGFGFLLAEKLLPEFVHPFQLQKPILDRCDENDQIMIVRVLKYVFVVLAFYVIPIFLLFIFYYEITNFYYEITKSILLGTIISFLICISFYYVTVLLRLTASIKYNKYSKSLRIYRKWKREQLEIIREKELEKRRKQEDSWKSLSGTKFEEELSIPYIGQGYPVSLSSTIRDKGVDIALTKKVNQDENSFNVGYVDDL